MRSVNAIVVGGTEADQPSLSRSTGCAKTTAEGSPRLGRASGAKDPELDAKHERRTAAEGGGPIFLNYDKIRRWTTKIDNNPKQWYIGGWAVGIYGAPRATGDMDVFIAVDDQHIALQAKPATLLI